jgi:aryl-alcohol dehydrogenase-like predicted oxidoreductase
MVPHSVELGLGLIGIGKPWGYSDPSVPDEGSAISLLETAFSLGIRYFDTAPSYGASERHLGRFLGSLSATERRETRIATKFGEHWNSESGQPFIDHSYAALRRSVHETIGRLGVPDVLQLHRTTPEALRSDDLARAWDYAHGAGITSRAASISDPVSADIVLADPRYNLVQLPFNIENRSFEGTIARASGQQVRVAVNRPFGMGKLLHEGGGIPIRQAFAFILRTRFAGVVLMGTKSPAHLRENLAAFREALDAVS